jgi:gluconolactonase
MSPFSPLVCCFIICLLLVSAASAGWPDLTGDWSVSFADFARLANAWYETPDGPNWDPLCDIAPLHSDGIIDEQDLKVIGDSWLADLPTDLLAPGATLQVVYHVDGKFFEGVTWDTSSNKLFFTNMTSKQILRLDSPGDPGSAYVWLNASVLTNGMFLSIDGRLLTADNSLKKVRSHRIGPTGPQDTQNLCSTSDPPNDLCQLSNGNIYITCQAGASSHQGVYLLKSGTLTLVKDGINQPNGVIASLDETKLYVSESSTADDSKKRWWVFPINPDGTLGTGSIFFQPPSPMRADRDPDGMTIDERGNLYLTGLGGLYIVSPAGVELMRISITEQSNNLTFGGPEYKTLYIACQDKIYSLDMAVHGGE